MTIKKIFFLGLCLNFFNVSLSGAALPPVPKISAAPASLNHGSVALGASSAPKAITVKNTGKSDLIINSVNTTGTDGADFNQTNDCGTIQPGGSCLVNVTFTPILPYANKTAMIAISSNDPKKPLLNIKLSGQVPPPAIAATPAALNFGKLPFGTLSSSKSVTVKNNGLSGLVIASTVISGTNPGDFTATSTCGTIQKGGSCAIKVVFAPLVAKVTRSASLNITSNDPKKPTLSLKLSGSSSSPPGATLQSIAVTPVNPSIPTGLTNQFTATGKYSDGTTQDITSSATWTSGTTSVAKVAAGGATGMGLGTSIITATSGSISGNTTLTVTAATLQSIAVTPPTPSISKSQSEQFTATGKYSDGTTQNITSSVTWTSGTTSVATVAAGGLATGIGAGSSAITATLAGVSGNTTLTVTPATLQSIAVTPPNPSITKSQSEQFMATGKYSDGTTQDITSSVTWTSGTTSVATVAASGLAIGIGAGSSAITATLAGVSGNTKLTVTASTLQSIAVTPPKPSIPKSQSEQFTATGTYSDGTSPDITSSATWTSGTTSVATVAAGGLATGIGVGSSAITATLAGVSGNTTLTVTPATLQSIAVTPSYPSITKSQSKQFMATGKYSDGTSKDITSSVTWTSGTTSVATIAASGLATGIGAGSSAITATLAGISGYTTLTVTPATLQSILVTTANPSIPAGLTSQFKATGTYSDGTTQDLTSSVTWTSDTPSVATVAAGVATGIEAGSAAIIATLGDISGNATLMVTPATLQSIAVTPADPSSPAGLTYQFTATGTYSDSTMQDLTSSATWSSDSTSIATVAAGGLATCIKVGSSDIKATSESISGSTTLTVTSPGIVEYVFSGPFGSGAVLTSPPVPITMITGAPTELVTTVGNAPIQVSVLNNDQQTFYMPILCQIGSQWVPKTFHSSWGITYPSSGPDPNDGGTYSGNNTYTKTWDFSLDAMGNMSADSSSQEYWNITTQLQVYSATSILSRHFTWSLSDGTATVSENDLTNEYYTPSNTDLLPWSNTYSYVGGGNFQALSVSPPVCSLDTQLVPIETLPAGSAIPAECF